MSGTTVTATDGVELDLSDLAQTLSYTSNILQYITVSYRGSTYKQTFTYTGSDLTGISAWVKQ